MKPEYQGGKPKQASRRVRERWDSPFGTDNVGRKPVNPTAG
jgi:hypothetical protein